jgi:O-acetyl-ADP-ribose deacetylase (regulator of RNase III)
MTAARAARTIGAAAVDVIVGDLTHLPERYDILVSSDDNYLSAGGGVSAALLRAARSPAVREEMDAAVGQGIAAQGSALRIGDVVPTSAGHLPADLILHAVTVDFDAGQRLDRSTAPQLTATVLWHAHDLGARSLAMPLLGSGSALLDEREAVDGVMEGVRRGALVSRAPERIALVLLDSDTARIAVGALAEAFTRTEVEEGLLRWGWSADGPLAGLARPWAVADGIDRAALIAFAERVHHLGDHALRRSGNTAVLSGGRALQDWANRIVDRADVDVRSDAWRIRESLLQVLPHVRDHPDLRHDGPSPSSPAADRMPESPIEAAGHNPQVQALADLVLSRIDEGRTAVLEAKFDALTYVGDFESKVVEWCLDHPPEEILTDQFTHADLVSLLKERRPSAELRDLAVRPSAELAVRLASTLGFRTPATPTGIRALREEFEALRAGAARATDPSGLTGCVLQGGQVIERVLTDLIRFYGHILLGESAEAQFRERGWTTKGRLSHELPLGDKIALLRKIDEATRQTDDEIGARFQRLRFEAPSILGPLGDVDGLVTRIRNDFAHSRDDMDELRSRGNAGLPELRRRSDQFFSEATTFLDHVQAHRVYPRVVAVEQHVQDRYGRSHIVAMTDEGVTERIFTHEPMAAGTSFFMHPLTNPIRIYPRLVPKQTTSEE